VSVFVASGTVVEQTVGAADHFGVLLHSPPSDLEELIFGFDDEPNQMELRMLAYPFVISSSLLPK
jgi:hypothetical protein